MTAPSDDLEAFLEAERDIDVPARSERERLFQRLSPLLVVPVALGAASAVATSAPLADSASSAVLSGALKAKIAAAITAAALVGGAVGVTGHAYLASPPLRPAVAPPSQHTALLPAPAPPAPVAPVPSEPLGATPPAPSAAAAASLAATRPEHPRPAGSLRAERLLIETASAALMRGDPESAIAALRQHARRFPNGDLAEEREVLLAKARAAASSGRAPAGEPGPSREAP